MKSTFKTVMLYVLLGLSALLIFFPILYAVLASFLRSDQLLVGNIIPTSLSFDNFLRAIHTVPLMTFMANSLIVSTTVMVGQIAVCSLAAFAIVFIDFRGKHVFFMVLISTMMIPWEAIVIPNYLTVVHLNWLNTYQGLSAPFFALAFGTFLLRQHFLTIPKDLQESAELEGCGRFRFFVSFILPLSKPMVSALGVYGFLTTWNMYLWPLLTTTNNHVRTVQIGLKMMISQETSTNWSAVMAGVVIVLMPTLLFLFLGLKQLKRGLMAGAVKG
ncbi:MULTISPECIES: carbohydrate ABC transporter permease [Paenibacillus]|uniref:Carbohydrate ABC transporter permease n=1 Tax=Paenibacillus oleatilyticus TaxID=2594886 RepID=A0ABV4V093_9BACL|nr:carbohydrate ABC transporter permease [Paenibacillus tyrfis]GLI06842.1 glycerol-3-phosphate ABC transporter permease [Paenibacillus tyrfis]